MRVLMVGLEGFSHGLAKGLILAWQLPVLSSLADGLVRGGVDLSSSRGSPALLDTILTGVNP